MLEEYLYICKRFITSSSIEGLSKLSDFRSRIEFLTIYEFHKDHLYPREHFKTVLLCLDIHSYLLSNMRQETSEMNISMLRLSLTKQEIS